jgi:hypothetical protein
MSLQHKGAYLLTREPNRFLFCQSKPAYKPNMLLQNTEITHMSEVKVLGMYITKNLSWRVHICSYAIVWVKIIP